MRLLHSFGTWSRVMLDLLEAPDGIARFRTLVTYLFGVVDPMHHDELRAKIDQLGLRAKGITMTIAEFLEEKGWKRGLEAGLEQGRIATLRRQLLFKFKLQTLDASYEARLHAATPDAVDRYAERVLTADSLAAVFEV